MISNRLEKIRAYKSAKVSSSSTSTIDFEKDFVGTLNKLLYEISRKDVDKAKRLSYLNSFTRFIIKKGVLFYNNVFYKNRINDIFICLRVCLVQEAPVVRQATLRLLRYLVNNEADIIFVNKIGISRLVVRSLDIVLNNYGERIQAVRFCQKILCVPNSAKIFPICITRSLISIGFDGSLENDKLHRSSISLLCQLALLNPLQFIECGGVRVLFHNIFGCESHLILEGILGSLLHLLNSPETRTLSGINLQFLVAPLTDIHFRHTGQVSNSKEKDIDERELGYRSSKIAIETLLRSWSGLCSFCHSGLKSLVDSIQIDQFEVRCTIIDLLCEIIGLKFPTWTDEVTVAVTAVDPSHPKSSWKLQEGFIVEEAMSILPHLSTVTPSITSNHMALLILCFVRAGLLEALVQVILTSDTFLSVRTTVLLGELLCLCDHYLPLSSFDSAHSIPSLIRQAMGSNSPNFSTSPSPNSTTSTSPSPRTRTSKSSTSPQTKQQRAIEAITVLNLLHDIKVRGPRAASVFLQMQIGYAGYSRRNSPVFIDRLGEVKLSRQLRKEIDLNPSKLLKETLVLASKDPMSWEWETIYCILKWCPLPLKKLEDSNYRLFVKRLVDFYKPSNKIFDQLSLDKENSNLYVHVGCALLEFLADSLQSFGGAMMLEEIVVDIATHLDELVRHKENPNWATWSPLKVESTLAQCYFLFIGKLSHLGRGVRILKKADIFQRLMDVLRVPHYEQYGKLIVSSLYYGEEQCREILNLALLSSNQRTRHYSTKFLRILVRIKPLNFSNWGIRLIVNQLEDECPAIRLTALDILEEAVHDKMFLESLIAIRPVLNNLGDRGILLETCFASLPSGLKYLNEHKHLDEQLKLWVLHYNKRYVELVEVLVRDSVSTLRRGEDGNYPERASKETQQSKFIDIFVPPHLYGQLTQQKAGFELLIEKGEISNLIDSPASNISENDKVESSDDQSFIREDEVSENILSQPTQKELAKKIVNEKACSNADQTKELKASLWALSHFATSADGLYLIQNSNVLSSMVDLGKNCPILSVRHTVFHSLCLISSTQEGALNLSKLDWFAMPRTHLERYPIWNNFLPSSPEPTIYKLQKLREVESEIEEADMIGEEGEGRKIRNESLNSYQDETDEIASCLELETSEFSDRKTDPLFIGVDKSPLYDDSKSLGELIEDEFDEMTKESSVGSSFLNSKQGSFRKGLRNRLSSLTSNLSSSESSSPRNGRLGNFGSWKLRRNRTESGGVGDDLSNSYTEGENEKKSPNAGGDYVQTLSPIPSSTSVNMSRYSISHRDKTLSEELYESKKYGSYRSITRKRTPYKLPDSPDSFPHSLTSPFRRLSLRESHSGSLDRAASHLFTPQDLHSLHSRTGGTLDRGAVISPQDLFTQSSILRRTATSLTTRSTPSYRSMWRGEESGNGEPCFMGLCLPKELSMIFIMDYENKSPFSTHVGLSPSTSFSSNKQNSFDIDSILESNSEGKVKDSELMLAVKDEVRRLISNMVSCIGAKSNEQNLLRLKQKAPRAFNDISMYSEVCDLISEYNIRLSLRRFLQELFLDLSYDEFYEVAQNITKLETVSINNNLNQSQIEEQAEPEIKTTKDFNQDDNYIDLK